MSYAKRTDGNHREIIDGLRAAGYTVLDLSKAGCGIPDALVVSKCGASMFAEIKMPGGKLTAAERKFREVYTGIYHIVYSLQETLDILAAIDERANIYVSE